MSHESTQPPLDGNTLVHDDDDDYREIVEKITGGWLQCTAMVVGVFLLVLVIPLPTDLRRGVNTESSHWC